MFEYSSKGRLLLWNESSSLCDFHIPSNQTNAGDCLAAGFIAAALKGLKQDAAVAAGLQAAISCFSAS